jgi:hypothetical protein
VPLQILFFLCDKCHVIKLGIRDSVKRDINAITEEKGGSMQKFKGTVYQDEVRKNSAEVERIFHNDFFSDGYRHLFLA